MDPVLIRPEAVNIFQQTGGTGYLNVWLDSNRDGDWDDVFQCPGNANAFEHIVIDYPVDVVALGPGYHTLPVPTGLQFWPPAGENSPAWFRVTLSERPSEKPFNDGGVDYGDGRGPALPYLLGETEDHIYIPPNVLDGWDIGLDMRPQFLGLVLVKNTDTMLVAKRLAYYPENTNRHIELPHTPKADAVLAKIAHPAVQDNLLMNSTV